MANNFTTSSSSPPAAAGSSLATLRALVRMNLGGRTDKDSLIDSALNMGLRQACQRHRFKRSSFQQDSTLTIDVATLTMPSNAKQVVEIRIIDGTLSHSVEVRDKTTLTRAMPNPAAYSSARPVYAYEENGVLTFVPTPDEAYTVRATYLQGSVDMTADTDTAGIEGVDNALSAYATAHVMRSLEKFSEADSWERQYEKELQSAIVADKRRPAIVHRMLPHPEMDPGGVGLPMGIVLAGARSSSRRW